MGKITSYMIFHCWLLKQAAAKEKYLTIFECFMLFAANLQYK